jgi:hypothetical protein
MMPRRGVRRGFGLVGFVGLVVTAGASGVSAQQPRSGPPTLEWGVLLEAVLPDSGTAQPASWSQIAARRLRVQWETSQPTPVAGAPGRFSLSGRTLMSHQGEYAAYTTGRQGGPDLSRPQITTLTLIGTRDGVERVILTLEARTFAERALFGEPVMKAAGAISRMEWCGEDDLMTRHWIGSFDWPGKRRAWYLMRSEGGSGGLNGDVEFAWQDPKSTNEAPIPIRWERCPGP